VSSWEGEERRSSDSILARAAVSAKEEADSLQSALEELPGRRFVRRSQLGRALEDARRREREALEMLQANRRQGRKPARELQTAADTSE
jgi:hypothetical protein